MILCISSVCLRTLWLMVCALPHFLLPLPPLASLPSPPLQVKNIMYHVLKDAVGVLQPSTSKMMGK